MSDTETADDGFDPDDYEDPEPRLPKGYLALDVYNICKQFSAGELTMEEGKYVTPYYVSKIIMEDNDGRSKKPSTGAISAVFRRWEEWGFAVFRKTPFAFTDFTEKGKELGLDGINRERAEINKMERARHARPKD